MKKFERELGRQIIALQVRLFACMARLQAGTDGEALHDLRIALRRLRSLLRPLRREPLCFALEQAAAGVGNASSPLRDLEVLADELQARGQAQAAWRRREQLVSGYADLLQGLALKRLLVLLDQWPEDQRQVQRSGEWQTGSKAVPRYLRKQRRSLAQALRDPAHDRHRLRLLIKRLRYCSEAWPQWALEDNAELRALRNAQSALGDWHDHWQWLQRLRDEADLQPCAAYWQERLRQAEALADQALQVLQEYFPQSQPHTA